MNPMVLGRMNALEEAFLTHERRYRTGNLQIGGLVMIAGPAPTIDDFRAYLRPRLASWAVLALMPGPTRPRGWVRSPFRDLSTQVFEYESGTLSGAVERIMATRLSLERPPWEIWLVHGYAEDEWAAVLKTSHALLDGASISRILCGLLDTDMPATPAPPPQPTRTRRRAADLVAVAKGAAGFAAGFFPLARKPFTCFHGTGERRFSSAASDREQLRRVAARHGVQDNDVFLAAVATALRHWPHTPWRGGRPASGVDADAGGPAPGRATAHPAVRRPACGCRCRVMNLTRWCAWPLLPPPPGGPRAPPPSRSPPSGCVPCRPGSSSWSSSSPSAVITSA